MYVFIPKLPLTSTAAKYHSLHAYLQMHKLKEWKACGIEMQPTEGG